MAFQSRGYTSVQDVNITFQTKYIVENAGSTCLAVSGSAPELGRWNVAECLLARETRVGSGNWSVTATMRPTENFFWKWLLVTPDRQKVIRWEDIDHREEFTGTEDREIFAGWNEEAVDVPRTTSKYQLYNLASILF